MSAENPLFGPLPWEQRPSGSLLILERVTPQHPNGVMCYRFEGEWDRDSDFCEVPKGPLLNDAKRRELAALLRILADQMEERA